MNRALYCIICLGLSCSLLAEDKPPSSFTFNHVALSVQDIDSSAAFYSQVLGLKEIVNQSEVAGIRWFSLGEGKELHLISVLREPVSVKKAVHFAITIPDFDSFLQILDKAGIEYSSWPGNPGDLTVRADQTRQIYTQDVDDYWIEVNSVASD